MSVLSLARPELLGFKGYSSARMEATGGAVFLNANESPWAPIADDPYRLNRYPEPQPAALLAAFAEVYQVKAEQVLIGRGSDEPIDLLTRAFCRAGQDAVLIMPPTFGMYRVCAGVQDAKVIEVPLRIDADFAVDWPALNLAIGADGDRRIKLIYFCSPNNPTGGEVDRGLLKQFVQQVQGRAIVVIDEAYQDFSEQPSCVSWINEFDHVVVLRTMSKAFGFAGARVGTMLAHTDVISLMRKIMAPYPVPSVVASLALQVLANRDQMLSNITQLTNERVRLQKVLAAVKAVRRVWPSAANFLSFQVDDSVQMYAQLKAAGVIVRDVAHYLGLPNCLRVSIGTRADNDRFLQALAGAP
jgi:histidinol-phosphate aminotransferase